jgi:hypothetical protein
MLLCLLLGCSGGGSGTCDLPNLTCGEVATTAEVTSVFGAPPVTYDENGHPNCSIKLTAGSGGVQVFCGESYASMLAGAKAGYPGAVTEPNNLGEATFEVQTADIVEVGFRTSDGTYAVLVHLITGAAEISKARALALVVDGNL